MQGRFEHRGATRTVEVRTGHCTLFDWDTGWLATGDRLMPAALLVDGGGWPPTVCGLVAATADEFGKTYVAFANRRRRGSESWASDAFLETGTFAGKFGMVESVLDALGLSFAQRGFLAAGPVEDLIGTELLEALENDADLRARWVPLFRGACWSSEPAGIRRRLRALLGLPPEEIPAASGRR